MTTWSPDLRHRLFPTRVLCDVANEHGIATAELLAGTGVTAAELDDPEAVVTAWDEVVLARRLLERIPDDTGVGIEVGSRFTLTHLGLFGFAVMSCGTLRELFAVAMRYFALTMLHIDVALFEGAKNAGDCMLELSADHLPADVRKFFIERDTAGIIATTASFVLPVVGKYAGRVSADVAIDREVLRPLLELIPFGNVAYGRAHNRLYFPRAMFDEPLPQADPHTLAACIGQCDVLMQRSERRRGITAVVRTKLFRDSGGFPALAEVATELDMHPRTLRRRLADEGTSYRALLGEARSALAVDLLCNVGLTVEEVSKRLGYTDPSTFSHAFKRWHGTAPSAYRR